MKTIHLTATPIGRRTFLAGVASSAVLSASGWASGQSAKSSPDLVLTNANVWTGDRAQPRAQAIALSGNRIKAVGSSAAVRQVASKDARVIDIGGRFLMPGFNDSHLHLSYMALAIDHVNLLGARNIADVLGRIRDRVGDSRPGEWVRGNPQWHEALLAESRMPTRQELDSVAPKNPVYIPRGGHVAVVNSKALEVVGLTHDVRDPPGGMYGRNASGEINGVLLETANWSFRKHLPKTDASRLRGQLDRQLKAFSELGITSLTDPGTPLEHIELLKTLQGQSPLGVRIHWTVGGNSSRAEELTRGYSLDQRSDVLKFSGLGEIGVDGGIEGAYLREPYKIVRGEQEDVTYRGVLMPMARDSNELERLYLSAIDAGYSFMTHVTGDAGLDEALRILRKVRDRKSFNHLRWTLHGCFLVDDTQLAEIKRLGLYVTAQTQPLLLGRQMVKWWGRERTDRSIPFRAFLDAGIPVGGGSDAAAGIANPLESIAWMVNRECLGGLQLDKKWSITPEEAMSIYTRGSAETQFMEGKVGTLAAGMLADIAILEADPSVEKREDVGKIKVDATVMDGRAVFDRQGLLS